MLKEGRIAGKMGTKEWNRGLGYWGQQEVEEAKQNFHMRGALGNNLRVLEDFYRNTLKERINKWNLIKIKSFCMAKENSIKMKREPTVWENIFANDTLDKSLIPKICKEVT